MSGIWRLTVSAMILIIAFSSMCWAQEESINTNPTGAHFKIRGPVKLSGRSPLLLSDLPLGEYDFTAQGPGLALSHGRIVRDDDGLRFRSWSDPTAMFAPPGVLHLMRKESRGWYHLGAGAISGTYWGLAYRDVQDAKDAIAAAEKAVAESTNSDDLDYAEVRLLETTALKNDKSRIRNLWGGYFATIWLGSGLEAWLFTPQPVVTESGSGHFTTRLPRATRWSAVLRSALVPGAGQRSMGRTTRSTVFSTAFAAATVSAILTQDSYLQARRAQISAEQRLKRASTGEATRQARLELEEATSKRDSKSTLRWVLTGATAYLYLWNVVDAYLIGEQAEASAPRLSVLPTPAGVTVSMSFRFP